MKWISIAAGMIASLSLNVYAANFDCSKASSATEKAICANKKLSILDDVMGVYFRSELSTSKDQALVKADQRKWNRNQRDICGPDVSCLEAAYLERLDGSLDASILNTFFIANDWKKGKYSPGSKFCSYEYARGTEKLALVVYCAGDGFNNILIK